MGKNYDVWLSYNNREEVLQLPVSPFFRLETAQGVETMNLQKLGQISLPGLRELESITLESFFPAQDYNFLKYHDIRDPWECVAMIKRWKESRRPIRLIITETNINLAMLVKNFNYGVEDGSDNVNFTLELVEYVFLETPKSATAYATTSESAVASSHAGDTEWKVRYGDTLTGIAKAVYGDTSMWKKIYEANKDLITNPDSLASIEGQTLTLPQKSTSSTGILTSETAVSLSYKDANEYVVKRGDTLTGIALAKYGDTSKWEDIYRANRDKITNYNSLAGIAGQTIVLPTYPTI